MFPSTEQGGVNFSDTIKCHGYRQIEMKYFHCTINRQSNFITANKICSNEVLIYVIKNQ